MINSNTLVENTFRKRSINFLLIFSLIILQVVGITLSILSNENIENTTIYLAYGFIVLSALSSYLLPRITRGDNTFVFLVNILYTISLIMILRLDANTAQKHIIWYILGIIFYLITFYIMKLLDNYLKDKTIFFFVITVITFLVTLGLGFTSGGARNWIQIGGITIQLSEFAKISYIFLVASFYYNYEKFTSHKFGKYYLVIATYVFVMLFFLQGELGTAMLFFAILISSMFVFERRLAFILLNIALGLIGIYLASFVLSHIKVRFDIWMDPWSDANNKGYQVVQGLFAIANGGFFGSGIGLGRPDLIPVVESDYILAAIIEEMGIFLGFAIILIYILLFYKSIKISLEFRSNYYSSLSMSIGLLYSVQALIMFGGILKLIPLTGITTPFLSYGGSSTISNFILLGVLQYLTAKTGVIYEKFNE